MGCALALLLLPYEKGVGSALFILSSLAEGLSNLVPFDTAVVVSDGGRILMLLRNGPAGARCIALLKLSGSLKRVRFPRRLRRAISPTAWPCVTTHPTRWVHTPWPGPQRTIGATMTRPRACSTWRSSIRRAVSRLCGLRSAPRNGGTKTLRYYAASTACVAGVVRRNLTNWPRVKRWRAITWPCALATTT